MDVDFLWKIAGFLIAAGAVYGGIRGDLREMKGRIERQEHGLEKMRERVDECVGCHGRRASDR